MNLVKDFTIIWGKERKEAQWSFRFGKCDDFKAAMNTLKTIPWQSRAYYPDDDHRWAVTANEKNEAILCTAFDNFASCLATARAQLPLF